MLYTDQIRSIFAASPNPCLILVPDKADFTIAGVNETWLQAVGVPNEQLVGKGLAHWLAENKVGFTPDSLVKLSASLRHVMQERKVHHLDLQKFHDAGDDGTSLQCFATANTPVFDKNGVISFVLHTMQDITGQVAMRHKLQISQQEYQSLFDQNPDAVFLLNTGGFFTMANKAALRLMERDDDKLLNNHFTEFCIPEDVPRLQDFFRESVNGKAFDLTMQALTPSGRLLELSVTVMPLILDGLPRGVYGIAKNITEGVKAQREQDLLSGLNRAFTGSESLSDCLNSSLRLFCAHTGSAIAEAWVTNIDNSELNLFARFSEQSCVMTDNCSSWRSKEGIIGLTWAKKETVVLDRYQENPDCRRQKFAMDNHIGSATGIPVILNGHVIAVFVFFNKLDEKTKRFSGFSDAVLGQLAAVIQQKKAESEYSQYFRLSPDMLCILGHDGYFKKVNPAFSRVLGFTEKELLASPHVDFVHPGDREETLQMSRECAGDNSPCPFENRFITKDGDIVWMSWTISVSNQERLIYAVARDVTEKKNLERIIEIEQFRFARMFDEAPVSMCILKGKDHVFEKANSLYYKYVGKKNIIGKTINEVFPEAHYQKVPEWLDHVYQTGETFTSFETPISVDLEGTGELYLFYLNFMFQAYRNNAGEIEGVFYFGVDVTEEVLARNELLKLSLIAKKTNNAVFITDSEDRIEWVNDAFCQITEYTAEDVIGKTSAMLHGPDTKSSVRSFMMEKNKRRQPFECELLNYTKSGKPFWVEIKRQPLFDTKGNLTHFFNIESDITERKEAYEKVLKSENEIRLFARQQNTIMEEERARIAREIHDEFGQQLTGLKMSLASLKKQLSTNPANAAEVLASLITDVDQSIQGLREFATELRPGILDTLGLFPSIGWLTRDFEKKNGIVSSASFKVKDDMRVNDKLAICFFRICQEALTNVAKHSGASHVHIEMEQIGEMLSMKITDNGRGIVSETTNNPFSMGLLGMRERANLVDGELFITSYPDSKTTVQFLVNIHNE